MKRVEAREVKPGDVIAHYSPARGRVRARLERLRVKAVREIGADGNIQLDTHRYSVVLHPREGVTVYENVFAHRESS